MGKVSIKYLGAASLGNVVAGKVQRVRQQIGMRVARLWREKVNSSTLSERARRRYADAIVPYGPPKAGAYVMDSIALLLEKGWKAFDMKPGLLSGRGHRAIPLGIGDGTKTIRTVSSGGGKGAWRHPGFTGAHVAQRVQQSLARLVREALSDES